MHISNSVFSALAGIVVGSLSTHLFAKARDKKNDEKKLRREMFGLLNSISFSFSMQYSQLYNLQKNLESRLAILGDELRMQERNDRTVAVQDFSLDSSIIINFSSISDLFGIVTNCFPDYQVNPGVFQCCYVSNKIYREMEEHLKKYNDVKQDIVKDENPLKAMVDFLKINIPCYLEMLKTYMPFIKTTHDSLAELFALLDKKPLQLGEPIELWGSKSRK